MDKFKQAINGNLWKIIGKGFELLMLTGILFWMFCQVRDMPAAYVMKAEYQQDKQQISEKIDKVNDKLDKLLFYVANKGRR
jgi:hypothetical protein